MGHLSRTKPDPGGYTSSHELSMCSQEALLNRTARQFKYQPGVKLDASMQGSQTELQRHSHTQNARLQSPCTARYCCSEPPRTHRDIIDSDDALFSLTCSGGGLALRHPRPLSAGFLDQGTSRLVAGGCMHLSGFRIMQLQTTCNTDETGPAIAWCQYQTGPKSSRVLHPACRSTQTTKTTRKVGGRCAVPTIHWPHSSVHTLAYFFFCFKRCSNASDDLSNLHNR
jgi:hypothetical protein